jgi:hypothetical protein
MSLTLQTQVSQIQLCLDKNEKQICETKNVSLGEVIIPNFCGKLNANSSFKYDLSNLSC